MEVPEAMDSRPPLSALSVSQENTEDHVDFSKLTPAKFGISTQSFLSSPKIADKSRVAQLKARRRSTIGVRGSPETNSLICFRAKQAAKTPPRTPHLLQGSPFVSRCDSLKKKMAAFQCLMEEDEEKEEVKNEQKKKDESVEITVRQDSQNEKENKLTKQSPSPMTPPPSKKRCRASGGECEDKITEMLLPCPTLTTLQEQRSPESELGTDSKNELLSLPMLSKPETKPSDVNEMSSARKKKRVWFGAPLSPEFFDKTLPPSTPLQKGGTPMCPPSSTGKKRSLLKTPQKFEPPTQPDFDSPPTNGGSPVFVFDRRNAGLVYSDDVFEKISFPSMDEEAPSARPSKEYKDLLLAEDLGQPEAEDTEVLNAAFQVDVDEPSASQMEEKLPSATNDQPSALSIEVDMQSVGNSEQQPSFNASSQPTRSRSRKRKQPAESQGEKRRSSRTAAASASGKMKKTSVVKKHFGNKEVDRSLYGKRDFASKNPLLSPIIETMSASFNSTPTQTLSGGEKDDIQTSTTLLSKTHQTVSLWRGTALSDAALTNDIEQTSSPVNQSDTGMNCLEPSARKDSGSKALKARRGSGRPARQRRSFGAAKKRKLSSSSVVLEVKTGEQVIDSQPSGEAAGFNQKNCDGPEVHVDEHSENLNVVPDDFMSTEQNTPERQGLVQNLLKSSYVKIDVVVEADDRIIDQTEFSDRTETALASWQQSDFNIDDILKPVAKSRGSVRRSLRNRRSIDLQAVGLAWVDHTSPEFSKVGRRRTRGRLSGVSEPCVTLVSEEPTPNLTE